MKNMQTAYGVRSKKECRECGAEIQEQRESIVYECERCMGHGEEQNGVGRRSAGCGSPFLWCGFGCGQYFSAADSIFDLRTVYPINWESKTVLRLLNKSLYFKLSPATELESILYDLESI